MITIPPGFDVSAFLNELFIFASLVVVPIVVFYFGVLTTKILRKIK